MSPVLLDFFFSPTVSVFPYISTLSTSLTSLSVRLSVRAFLHAAPVRNRVMPEHAALFFPEPEFDSIPDARSSFPVKSLRRSHTRRRLRSDVCRRHTSSPATFPGSYSWITGVFTVRVLDLLTIHEGQADLTGSGTGLRTACGEVPEHDSR